MRADDSHHVVQAARRRSEQTRQRALTALQRMDTPASASPSTPSHVRLASPGVGVRPSW
ncbi:MAG: hypothetical protein JWN00_3016 [Actinomycetia bacterium]|nr:hypothetical protein [Actinomycetes bacterium]